ncbi:MAG TPA: TIGR03067 domain-containing protein, partial [Vicinamibacterales bacterium]|nr:TIGR03067 domain-containing protein [Vicinamibacterales bacterium]
MLLRPIVVLALALVCSSGLADRAVAVEDLTGTWLPSAAELAGVKYPDEVRKTITLVIKDDTYSVSVGTLVDRGTMKLNGDATPKEMDVTGTDGPNKGRTIHAIYEHTA